MSNNRNHKSKASDAIISTVFLIWFVASIGLLIYFAKTGKTALALAVFGQYFLVFGIAGMVSSISSGGFRLSTLPILLFPIVGLTTLAGGIITQYGSEEFKKKCIDSLPMVFIILFIVIGICLIICGLYSGLYLKLVCKEYVSAQCIEVRKQYMGDKGEKYCPVYTYEYNGQSYKACDDVYTDKYFHTVGIDYELYINPKKPTQFYEPRKSTGTGIFLIGFGVIIVAFMAFVLFMINK
ncbi:MAG: DUF3592 domain-containing protein [Lachnospiraceae bacterium]|nr:DUF3592 domain-containing protein [Lachnospiraceae bacterium]